MSGSNGNKNKRGYRLEYYDDDETLVYGMYCITNVRWVWCPFDYEMCLFGTLISANEEEPIKEILINCKWFNEFKSEQMKYPELSYMYAGVNYKRFRLHLERVIDKKQLFDFFY